jgi:hypothetical protein
MAALRQARAFQFPLHSGQRKNKGKGLKLRWRELI